MTKKIKYALAAGLAFLLAAGVIETLPALSFALLAVMGALVWLGELWEA